MGHRESAAIDGLDLVCCLVGIEQQIGSAAARGMRGHLPTQLAGYFRHFEQVLARYGEHAPVIGISEAVDPGVRSVRLAQNSCADENAA